MTDIVRPDGISAPPQQMLDWIAFLEARLEIDQVHLAQAGQSRVAIAVAPASRLEVIRDGLDGIGCRDETIRLLQVAAAERTAKNDDLKLAIDAILRLCAADPDDTTLQSIADLARDALGETGQANIEAFTETVMRRAWIDGFTSARDTVDSCIIIPEPTNMADTKRWILGVLNTTRDRCLAGHPEEPPVMTAVRERLAARSKAGKP